MAVLVAIVAAVLGLSLFASWVNARHEARTRGADAPPDARVDTLWEGFGLIEDEADAITQVDALLEVAPPAKLLRKQSAVRLSLMALKTGRTDVLPAIAERLQQLSGGCGETLAVCGLAEAHAGSDRARARELLEAAGQSLGACMGCGSAPEGRLLLEEAAAAFELVAEPAEEAHPAALSVRLGG